MLEQRYSVLVTLVPIWNIKALETNNCAVFQQAAHYREVHAHVSYSFSTGLIKQLLYCAYWLASHSLKWDAEICTHCRHQDLSILLQTDAWNNKHNLISCGRGLMTKSCLAPVQLLNEMVNTSFHEAHLLITFCTAAIHILIIRLLPALDQIRLIIKSIECFPHASSWLFLSPCKIKPNDETHAATWTRNLGLYVWNLREEVPVLLRALKKWVQIAVKRCHQTCPVYSRKRVFPQLNVLLIESWFMMGMALALQQWEHQRHSYCFACCCDWRAISEAALIDSPWDHSQKRSTNVFPWVTTTQLKRQLHSQSHSQLVVWSFLWPIQSHTSMGDSYVFLLVLVLIGSRNLIDK